MLKYEATLNRVSIFLLRRAAPVVRAIRMYFSLIFGFYHLRFLTTYFNDLWLWLKLSLILMVCSFHTKKYLARCCLDMRRILSYTSFLKKMARVLPSSMLVFYRYKSFPACLYCSRSFSFLICWDASTLIYTKELCLAIYKCLLRRRSSLSRPLMRSWPSYCPSILIFEYFFQMRKAFSILLGEIVVRLTLWLATDRSFRRPLLV